MFLWKMKNLNVFFERRSECDMTAGSGLRLTKSGTVTGCFSSVAFLDFGLGLVDEIFLRKGFMDITKVFARWCKLLHWKS